MKCASCTNIKKNQCNDSPFAAYFSSFLTKHKNWHTNFFRFSGTYDMGGRGFNKDD